jgi:hypothetical protein
MIVPNSPPVPAWVRKRDGRLVPFEADRICRALFAASEQCGKPDAFLARELADVAVHFLAEETEGITPTTAQVREVVVKVLRELKQLPLAGAFEQRTQLRNGEPPEAQQRSREVVLRFAPTAAPVEVRDSCLRSYTLQTVFTRDLMAAHQDRLIVLDGLETPEALNTVAVGPLSRTEDLVARIEEAASVAGQTLVLEGVEQALAAHKRPSRQRLEEAARAFAANLELALRLTGRRAVVNLNGSPPPWAEATSGGPLFGEQQETDASRLAQLADVLAESILEQGSDRIRIDWHLGEQDLTPQAVDRLLPLTRDALASGSLAFVFGRSRRPLSLAEGIERGQPAVLLAIGLNLPHLAELVVKETDEAKRGERFRDRLRSLARLALSAALQKREYLRCRVAERPALASGFLLERARLLVAPLGLDEALVALTGQNPCASEETLDLANSVLLRLRETLRDEGRASTLETCVDALPGRDVSGPTCWNADAPFKNQLRAIGSLHTAAGGGTGVAFLPPDPQPTAEQVAGWLRWAGTQTSVSRLFLRRSHPPLRQMTFVEAGD